MEYAQTAFTASRKKKGKELCHVVKTMILIVLQQKNYVYTQKKKKLKQEKTVGI